MSPHILIFIKGNAMNGASRAKNPIVTLDQNIDPTQRWRNTVDERSSAIRDYEKKTRIQLTIIFIAAATLGVTYAVSRICNDNDYIKKDVTALTGALIVALSVFGFDPGIPEETELPSQYNLRTADGVVQFRNDIRRANDPTDLIIPHDLVLSGALDEETFNVFVQLRTRFGNAEYARQTHMPERSPDEEHLVADQLSLEWSLMKKTLLSNLANPT